MLKKLKNKKKRINVTQFEKKFNEAINFRIKQLKQLSDLSIYPKIFIEYESRLDELETLKAYLENSV